MTAADLVAQSLDVLSGDRIRAALAAGDPIMHLQPILALSTGAVSGWEALARFPHLDGSPPDHVFAAATEIGLGPDLEALAVAKALEAAAGRPAGTTVSVNASPSALGSRALLDVLPRDLAGIQVEITEHEHVTDVGTLLVDIARLRSRGARIAIDDVGEGYAGLQRLMDIRPDLLKLDRSLVTGIDVEPARAALVEAIVRFAARTGAWVCAEGVETLAELAAVADLDVAQAQGWAIGRPAPELVDADADARQVCDDTLRAVLELGGRPAPGERVELAAVLVEVAETGDLDALARMAPRLADAVGCARVDLSCYDEPGNFLEGVLASGWVLEGQRYALADYPLSAEVLARNVAAQVVLGAPGADPAESAVLLEERFGSVLIIPVRCAGRPVGMLEAYQLEPLPFTRRQIRAARSLAAVVGPVLARLLGG
jgi:EAL domain-containing protein (putative c-di-GMP-specific phosphodiesterase class I)